MAEIYRKCDFSCTREGHFRVARDSGGISNRPRCPSKVASKHGLPISSAPDVDFLMPPRKTSRSLKSAQTVESRFAKVNGVRMHYLVAGKGDPIVLLHGYAETSHMWRPLIAKLAVAHTVIAPDLRGAGQSSTPTECLAPWRPWYSHANGRSA